MEYLNQLWEQKAGKGCRVEVVPAFGDVPPTWGPLKRQGRCFYSSQGDQWVWQASLLGTCASHGSQHPGLTIAHRSPSACDPLPQDGHAASALVQFRPFLDVLGLCTGQDILLLESMQLFGKMCGC